MRFTTPSSTPHPEAPARRSRSKAVMQKLRWRLNRLRLMSAGEIVWRLVQSGQARLERHGFWRANPGQPCRNTYGKSWLDALPVDLARQSYVAAADQIVAGRFTVFALRDTFLGFPPSWNRDPKTGICAPLVFGKTLHYRDPSVVGDIKYLWELNRHYELVTLAQAYFLSKQTRHAAACRTLLESWFEQCPYPMGQGWSSALENAIRLVNWAFAWHLLGGANSAIFAGEAGDRFKQCWLQCIYRHCHFIANHLSRHSSANNHLLGEYMGLYIGATTWPCWAPSASWRELSQYGLEVEALKQNTSDGVNREQAIWYHHEVAEMMLLCGLYGKANGTLFTDAFWQRLESMLTFIVSVMDSAGNVPMIGDADDATMHLSCESGGNPYRSLLACGAVLFGRVDFKAKAGRFDDKSRWLLGDLQASTFLALAHPAETQARYPVRRAFPEGGYYLLGADFDTASEVRLVADAGALGYLAIAAHGHADALAFTLSVAGKPILVDSGTYAYHTQENWRHYFRGTAAHNTVRVDGLDQSVQGGNFMWLHKASAVCEQWESTPEQDCFIGRHDGYRCLRDPVIHRRKLLFLKPQRLLIVEDVLECCGTHQIETSWHFSDQCTLEIDTASAIARRANVRLEMVMPDSPGVLHLVTGREVPPLGWISHRFDEKTPAPSLVWHETITGTVRRLTRFKIVID